VVRKDLHDVFSTLGSSVGRVRERREITVAFVGGDAVMLALAALPPAAGSSASPNAAQALSTPELS
jgi:hypothetical protein